jgi:MprA protease rhombosortase-interaction domain-containing protein
MYDADGNNNVGNEDSAYLSPAFNKNSAGDWVGFQGLDFDENDVSGNVDVPNPGYAADPDGFKPSTADSTNDGWYALRDWGVKSEGAVNLTNLANSGLFNGNFNWYNRPFFVGAASGGGFASDFGFKTEYIVTQEMVGQTLTFEMGNREPYGVFDGFLFIQTSNIYPNMDLLDIYSQADLDEAILPKPVEGDYNDNGTVDAADYVLWRKDPSAFGGDPAGYNTWRTNFGSTSGSGAVLVGGAVPEPGAILLILIGLAGFQTARQCRRD